MELKTDRRDTLIASTYDANVKTKKALHVVMQRFLITALFGSLLLNMGCSQQSLDKEIKADMVTKTKTDLNFAGVSYTVEGGVVTLTGICPSEKSRAEAEKTIKSINIVKSINNQIIIAPLTLTSDLPLKQSVDSVLAAYPTIQADVTQQVVTLKGKAKKQETDKLMPAINMLHPAKIDTQLVMQ